MAPLFSDLVHADLSIDAGKRWLAPAEHVGGAWRIDAPRPVGPVSNLLEQAFERGRQRPVLLGFDFPIGLPVAYGRLTGFSGFPEALPAFGTGDWLAYYDVASRPEEITIKRPFYPQRSQKGVSRQTLIDGLGVASYDALLRVCERQTASQRAACALFWTLGGNQVGKAASAGWREVVSPALAGGAALWPYDGALAELSAKAGVVIAETYPALAYRMIGAEFRPSESKRRQVDRAAKAPAVLRWAERHEVRLSEAAQLALADGFGKASTGEDAFDAFFGVLKMIEVVDGRRVEASEAHPESTVWEGWILGR